MLAPTFETKQRWVQALQSATSRRIFTQRRPSCLEVTNSLLLALDSPQNIGINCTEILDNEWLLMGGQEGLFVTNLNNIRAPFHIAGLSSIYFMELLLDYEMLFVLYLITLNIHKNLTIIT